MPLKFEHEVLDEVLRSNAYVRHYRGPKPCVICGTKNAYMIENILLSDYNNPQCAHEGECLIRARSRPRAAEVGMDK